MSYTIKVFQTHNEVEVAEESIKVNLGLAKLKFVKLVADLYILPVATETTLGGVKSGGDIEIDLTGHVHLKRQHVVNSFVAGANLSALRVVYLDHVTNQIFYADHRNADHAYKVIGITLESGNAGDRLQVLQQGYVDDEFFPWLPDSAFRLYLGQTGFFQNQVPETGFILDIGFRSGSTSAHINLQPPIFLGA